MLSLLIIFFAVAIVFSFLCSMWEAVLPVRVADGWWVDVPTSHSATAFPAGVCRNTMAGIVSETGGICVLDGAIVTPTGGT